MKARQVSNRAGVRQLLGRFILKCNTAPKTVIDTKQEESLLSLHSFGKHMEIIVGPETHIHNSHCASRASTPALRTLTERREYWNANPHTKHWDLRSQCSHNEQHYQLEQGSQTRSAAVELAGVHQHGKDLQAKQLSCL